MNRALRRHQFETLKRRRRHYRMTAVPDDPRRAGIVTRTPAVCSCTRCGNPRRHFGERTRQEKAAEHQFRVEMEDWQEYWRVEPDYWWDDETDWWYEYLRSVDRARDVQGSEYPDERLVDWFLALVDVPEWYGDEGYSEYDRA